MGYRLLVALCAVVLVSGCAALDTDNTPYEGMQPGDPIPGLGVGGGLYAGYYAGDMTLESNACESVADEVGSAVPLAVEIVHAEKQIEAIFEDDVKVAGMLLGENVTLVVETMGVKHVYRFTFAGGAITGSAEVIETNEAGQYGSACATYALSLKKGEKPAEAPEAEGEGEDEEATPL